MELTNILGKLKSDKEPPKSFLALELTDDLVQAAVWHVEEGTTQVVALGNPVEWQHDKSDKTSDSLVQAVDATISTAIEGLISEPSEVVFGLPRNWTNDEGIVQDKLKLISLICHELDLKPLGFVQVVDSLLRYLKMQEGTPSTSILIQVNHADLVVNLVKLGKVEGAQLVGRSDDIATDVEEGISRLQVTGNLPSRIIVFDGMHNLEEIVQNLVSYDWQSKFEFLHLPKVESLPKDVVIRSIAIAGGAEVAKSIGLEVADPVAPNLAPPPSPIAPPPKPATTTVSLDLDEPQLVPATDFGFGLAESKATHPQVESPEPSNPTDTPTSRPTKPSRPKFKLALPSFPKLASPKMPRLRPSKLGGPMGIGLVVAISLAVVLGLSYWFVPHARVTILVKPKVLEEVVALTLSTTTSSLDPTSTVVPATLLETTVQGDSSANATGEKTVGDKASGEVVIYNRTDLVKIFPAGTTLSVGNLDFTLDEDVTVASSSAGSDYVVVPGRSTAKLTATTIGEDSNLVQDSEFSIENFSKSNYVARNESSLSGGSSREITVVSQDDIDSLIESLSISLADQARDELLSSSTPGSGIYLLEDSLEIISESYSSEVGEESDVIKATLEVSIKGISYKTTDVEALVASAIESAIPTGYTRTIDLPTVELSAATQESDDTVLADARVAVRLLPMIEASTLQAALRGLSASEIEPTLSRIVGMESAHVEITPKLLPPRLKSMPRNPNNITVTIQAAK